jgi:hypothetical protein
MARHQSKDCSRPLHEHPDRLPETIMPNVTLDHVLDALDRAHQRATYGAVAALLGEAPRTLMKGRTRDPRHSWVVSSLSGEPTGYTPDLVHPQLREHEQILRTREELERWLDAALAAV